jgi:hypothetical protein
MQLLADADDLRGPVPGLFAPAGRLLGVRAGHRHPLAALLRRPGISRDSFIGNLPLRCQGCGLAGNCVMKAGGDDR